MKQEPVQDMHKLTAVEWLVDQLSKQGRFKSLPSELYKKALEMEEQIIKDAIMYSLDEDGHTGDWKIKFANDYIHKLKQTK